MNLLGKLSLRVAARFTREHNQVRIRGGHGPSLFGVVGLAFAIDYLLEPLRLLLLANTRLFRASVRTKHIQDLAAFLPKLIGPIDRRIEHHDDVDSAKRSLKLVQLIADDETRPSRHLWERHLLVEGDGGLGGVVRRSQSGVNMLEQQHETFHDNEEAPAFQ